MNKKYIWLSISTFVIIAFLISINASFLAKNSNDLDNPDYVIENLYNAINIAKENGNYKCCIEPACTMCYLGHWKFEKGTCFCDDAIASGNDELVCPECKAGFEQGICNSGENNGEFCEV